MTSSQSFDQPLVRRPLLDVTIRRVQAEYLEMPGLELTPWQAQRLWHLEEIDCEGILRALVDAAFLRQTKSGTYVRATNG